jgi:ribosomal protein S18 acetylase RimI-like enzyme
MKMQRVTPKHNLLQACREFLSADPVTNVLTLGDLYHPLFNLSEVYAATDNRKVIGVSSVFHAFSLPTIAIGKAEKPIRRALLRKALETISEDFIVLDTIDQTSLYEEYATTVDSFTEHHMILTHPKNAKANSNVKAQKATKHDLQALNLFYTEHESPAWNPIQFKTGPYYIAKQKGKIVSAAGIHILTPQIAQLGNILTDKAHRRKGYSKACTQALIKALSKKTRTIGLFVRIDNTPAIRMYEQMGFRKARTMNFLILRKKPNKKKTAR